MLKPLHRFKKISRLAVIIFGASVIGLSMVGAYIGLKGNKVIFNQWPTQGYEEISFPSLARDQIQLNGWFLPALVRPGRTTAGQPTDKLLSETSKSQTEKVVIIVHGWGGHRARLLPLAEFLQSSDLNVLTFDLRGGTGRNTYGLRESGDIAGAVAYLKTNRKFTSENISLIGVSMGGAAAVDFASKNPVGQLVLISPIIDIGQAKYRVLKDRHFIFPSIYAAGATLVEWLIFGVRPANPIKIFDRIDEPTLILHGTADKLSPVTDVYRLRRQLLQRGQKNVTFQIIDHAEHNFLDHDKTNGFPYSQKILEFVRPAGVR